MCDAGIWDSRPEERSRRRGRDAQTFISNTRASQPSAVLYTVSWKIMLQLGYVRRIAVHVWSSTCTTDDSCRTAHGKTAMEETEGGPDTAASTSDSSIYWQTDRAT